MEEGAENRTERVEATYCGGCDAFVLKEKSFTQQFSHVYSQRTSLMRGILTYRLIHDFYVLIIEKCTKPVSCVWQESCQENLG